eukprot:Colp12_sorted_trinity150504_noHs@735
MFGFKSLGDLFGQGGKPSESNDEKAAENTANAGDSGAFDFNAFVSNIGKELSSVATKIQKTVEEATSELTQEHTNFLKEKEKQKRKEDSGVPPWVGYKEEEQMKAQILVLSEDQRHFLVDPPSGAQFNFSLETYFPIALATLKEDPNLEKMRFALVPKKVSEERFWRNYFYRVTLIKQSSQLTSISKTAKRNQEEDGSAQFQNPTAFSTTPTTSAMGTTTEGGNHKSNGWVDNAENLVDFASDSTAEAAASEQAPAPGMLKALEAQSQASKPEDTTTSAAESKKDEDLDWEKALNLELQEFDPSSLGDVDLNIDWENTDVSGITDADLEAALASDDI